MLRWSCYFGAFAAWLLGPCNRSKREVLPVRHWKQGMRRGKANHQPLICEAVILQTAGASELSVEKFLPA